MFTFFFVYLFSCRLVNAPALEAAELADKLSSREDAVLKKTLVSLQKLIKVGYISH